MKGLVCWLLVLCMLAGCGAGASDGAQSQEAAETAASATAASVPEYTDEELFLQEAYWYLQSDEKALFSWENGMVEDYCTQEHQEIISPQGLTDIHGKTLRRVSYPLGYIGENGYEMVSLYFDGDGGFVGTDYSTMLNDAAYMHDGGPWTGDIGLWLFPEKQEISMGETQTIICVLRNTGEETWTVRTYAPKIMAVQYYQGGQSPSVGLASSSKEITLEPGEVFVESYTMTPEDWNEIEWMPYVPGPCTAACYVPLREVPDGISFTLSKTVSFTITE